MSHLTKEEDDKLYDLLKTEDKFNQEVALQIMYGKKMPLRDIVNYIHTLFLAPTYIYDRKKVIVIRGSDQSESREFHLLGVYISIVRLTDRGWLSMYYKEEEDRDAYLGETLGLGKQLREDILNQLEELLKEKSWPKD